MGLHAMYDSYRNRSPSSTEPVPTWYVHFTDDLGQPDRYEYRSAVHAEHSAAQLRADGCTDVLVSREP